MNPLPVIPTPLAQRWREFRFRVVPLLVFSGVLLVLAVMWRQYVAPPTMVGQVEPITAYVTSPKPGTLAQLNLARMQRVKSGDPVAQVIITDPKVLTSSLAVIQAEIQLLRVNLQPVIDQQRYAINYDRLRLDWLSQRVDLATARVKLQLAENDLRRASELFKDKIVSEKVFDQMKTARDTLQAEVEELLSIRFCVSEGIRVHDVALVGHVMHTHAGPARHIGRVGAAVCECRRVTGVARDEVPHELCVREIRGQG